MVDESTHELVSLFFTEGKLPKKVGKLEPKKKMESHFKQEFCRSLDDNLNPILGFQLLYHRLSKISNVAKDVFYEPAIELLKEQDEATQQLFGAKTTLRTSQKFSVIKSPKIYSLEKEKHKLEKKNKKLVAKYENYQASVKSIDKQIKAEEERLAKEGMVTDTEEKHNISLSY